MLYGSLGLLGHAKQMIDVWTLTREKAELTLFEYTINIPEM